MKKKKSILYFFIFSFIFVFFFFLAIFLLANRHWFYPYETVIEYKYDSDKDDKIDELKDECEKLLVAQNDYDKFISDFNELKTIYTEIGTDYKIEYLNVCNNPLKGNIRLMNIYYEKKVELSKWFGSLYSKINESAYKNQFFNGVDEKEINYLIKSHSEEASKKYEVISNISEEFQNLDDDKQISQFATYYTKFINANNEYAKVVGYDNYYNYANEKEYSRDYSAEDILEYCNYVYTYFIKDFKMHDGIYYNTYDYYRKNHKSDNLFNNFSMSDLALNFETNHHSKYEDLISLYAESLGSDYYNEYVNFKNDGILIESNKEGCYEGGFTTYLPYLEKPAMFLGGSTYQTLFVYVHEFGHYYNFTKSKANDVSLDLCETHSQANELLFLSYILRESSKFTNTEIRHILASKLENFTRMAIYTALIGAIEYEAYNQGTVTEDTISTIISDTVDKYFPGLYSIFVRENIEAYIKGVLIEHPMYYISYSTSICSSLDLFEVSLHSYNDAKEKYLYIQNYDNYQGYVNTLTNAGLKNPFTEEFFIELSDLFNRLG